jgi:hypothetical protein
MRLAIVLGSLFVLIIFPYLTIFFTQKTFTLLQHHDFELNLIIRYLNIFFQVV